MRRDCTTALQPGARARLCLKQKKNALSALNHIISQQSSQAGTIILLILQLRKPKQRNYTILDTGQNMEVGRTAHPPGHAKDH